MRERVIGLIADTHGLVRRGVHDAFAGVELILHAGDVGDDGVFEELESIAPLLAVRGNTDRPGDPRLPLELICDVGGLAVHMSHGHECGTPTPARLLARYTQPVLVYGHTHRPLITRVGDRIVVNPGAAGPRRFDLVPSVARLHVRDGVADVHIIELPGDDQPTDP